jgi:hypothetical protein
VGWLAVAAVFVSQSDDWLLGGESILPNLAVAGFLFILPLVGRWPLPLWRVLLAAVIWCGPALPLAYVVTPIPVLAGLGLGAVSVFLIIKSQPEQQNGLNRPGIPETVFGASHLSVW